MLPFSLTFSLASIYAPFFPLSILFRVVSLKTVLLSVDGDFSPGEPLFLNF